LLAANQNIGRISACPIVLLPVHLLDIDRFGVAVKLQDGFGQSILIQLFQIPGMFPICNLLKIKYDVAHHKDLSKGGLAIESFTQDFWLD